MRKINDKGISLIELIIAIAIMSVLAGVVAPQYLKYVERSKRTVDINTAKEIVNSFERVFATDAPDVKVDGKEFVSIAWDKSAKMAVPGTEKNFIDFVFADLGEVPKSQAFPNAIWIVDYSKIGEVEKVSLFDPKSKQSFELYPDHSGFI